MPTHVNEIYGFIGSVVAYGGGGAAIAYLIFQFLGKSWIENRFKERLEDLKHDQAKEVQRLRIEIDSMLSGVLKLQEREFEVLPEAWRLLDKAKSLVVWIVSPSQEFPDLNGMDEARLDAFLDQCDLNSIERIEVKEAEDHTDEYMKRIFWYRLARVREAQREMENYVACNAIFFPADMQRRYELICALLNSAVVSKKIGHTYEDFKMQLQGWTKVREEIEPLYKEIEKEIRLRLRAHAAHSGLSIPD